jgi:hypothetical protein
MSRWTWRREAARAIDEAIDRGRAEGLAGMELKAFVRKHGYPFGPRKHHPYKVWLSEMRRRFAPKEGGLTAADRTPYDAWIAGLKASFAAAGPTTSPSARGRAP